MYSLGPVPIAAVVLHGSADVCESRVSSARSRLTEKRDPAAVRIVSAERQRGVCDVAASSSVASDITKSSVSCETIGDGMGVRLVCFAPQPNKRAYLVLATRLLYCIYLPSILQYWRTTILVAMLVLGSAVCTGLLCASQCVLTLSATGFYLYV